MDLIRPPFGVHLRKKLIKPIKSLFHACDDMPTPELLEDLLALQHTIERMKHRLETAHEHSLEKGEYQKTIMIESLQTILHPLTGEKSGLTYFIHYLEHRGDNMESEELKKDLASLLEDIIDKLEHFEKQYHEELQTTRL